MTAKTCSLTLFKQAAAFLAMTALSAGLNPRASASSFTTGNLVVTRFGDGSAALGGGATPMFVLEYLSSAANQASPVTTTAIPTNGANRLTATGNSTSEGFIARSLDGSIVTFQGYDANAGTAGIAGTLAAGTNRFVGQLDGNGNFARAAGGSTDFSGSNIRSSISDGTNYWIAGTASSATNGGVWYSAGGAPPTQITNGVSTGNLRVTRIYNGALYFSTASGKTGIWAFSGIPTSQAAATNMIAGGGSPYDFAINPAGTVLYMADSSGGILKWTYAGGAWTLKITFAAANGLPNGCNGLAVDFSGANPVLYATTSETQTNRLITLTDTSAFIDGSDTADQATTLATAPANTVFRGVAFAPVNTSTAAPAITGISPLSATNLVGSAASFTVSATGGTPFGFAWYKETPGTGTNLIPGATTATLLIPSAALGDSGLYQAVVSNAYSAQAATSAVVSLTVLSAVPAISGIGPSGTNVPAGGTASFTVAASGAPPLGYQWYKETAGATNLIAGATTATLTLSNVLGGDAANYQVVVTNTSSTAATSTVVSLTVSNDPNLQTQPANTYGLLDGAVYFSVTAAGTSPSFQWYFADTNGNLLAPAGTGSSTASGAAVVSGGNTGTLTVTNLQTADLTNFVVVVSNAYGSATSSVASLLAVNLTNSILAFWDFNGPEFTNQLVNPNCVYDPVPYLGAGTASAVGTCFNPGNILSSSFSPFSGSVDANDGLGFTAHLPPFSWGASHYPLTGGNKQNGVRFNVSTLGAKNIKVSYQSRVSATASDYERLQYTADGTNWVDFPSSSTFGGVGTTYLPFSYDLTGFPGAANNPGFGVRVVTEYQSTATYGISGNTNYTGTANTYSSGGAGGFAAGTVTYDLVTVTGDAITNAYAPPAVSGFMDTNAPDYLPLTNNFTVTGGSTPPDLMTYAAVSLNPSLVSPSFSFGGSGTNRTLVITPNSIRDSVDAAPILVTVTDTNGDSTASWFALTLTSLNLPPTNSLGGLAATNTLVNTPLTLQFTLSDDRTSADNLTCEVTSQNNTLIPTGNLQVSSQGANVSLTLTPATNQVGVGVIVVTVIDNDPVDPKSTTTQLIVSVLPNTNVVAIDDFDYDATGALDAVSGGFWQHLSGVFGQMQVGVVPGAVNVDALNNTENLQTPLLGGPYQTNSGVTLYASYVVSYNDPSKLPTANGTYITTFNDGSGVTGPYECLLVAATNGAAPGAYRLGVANSTNDSSGAVNAASARMFPQDLLPGTGYLVVTSLAVSNGFSTLWINPTGPSSPSVSDTTPAAPPRSIGDFELRESGQPSGGVAGISDLVIGTTFDAVLPPVSGLSIQLDGTNAVLNWSNPTSVLQSTANLLIPFADVAGATSPYTNNTSTNAVMFFRLRE